MYVFRWTAFHTAHTFKHSKFCMTVLLIICPLAPAQTPCWCVSRVCLGLTHLILCSLASSISLSLSLSSLSYVFKKIHVIYSLFVTYFVYDYFSLSFAKRVCFSNVYGRGKCDRYFTVLSSAVLCIHSQITFGHAQLTINVIFSHANGFTSL